MATNKMAMRICFVYCQELKKNRKGYSEQHPCRMARIMGDSAKVFALYAGEADKDYFIENGVIPIQIKTGLLGKGYLKKIAALIYYSRKIGRDYKIDVFLNVWSHYLMLPVWAGSRFCRSKCVGSLGGIPIKTDYVHKAKTPVNALKKMAGLMLEWLSLKAVDSIHCVSHRLKDVYINRQIPKEKIHVISRGIDFKMFNVKVKLKQRDQKRIIIGTVCNLTKLKDVETSIDCIKSLRKEYYDIRLFIGGDGAHKEKLIAYVKQKSLENNVVFLGYLNREELIKFYSSIDIFVLSSASEGIANVILEALSCGLEIVATNVGDISLHLEHGRGKIFQAGDSNAMVTLLKNAIGSSDAINGKINGKEEYVKKYHSFESVRGQYIDFFNEVLKK